MTYYYGIVYFKNGTTRTTGKSNSRQQAEKMARQLFDQAMRTAVSDFFKPTRYEVVEEPTNKEGVMKVEEVVNEETGEWRLI